MEHTWLAYAFVQATAQERIERALGRVVGHYQEIVSYPLERRGRVGSRLGAVVWTERDGVSPWPLWSEQGYLGVATAYLPIGWERVVGDVGTAAAPVAVARALLQDPRRVGELTAPFGMAVCEGEAETLTIFNDSAGAASLFEMTLPDGWVWSNRLGALPLFAGVVPEADPRGWAMLAGLGWFVGETTPIRGTRKVPRDSVITVAGSNRHIASTGALQRLVEPRRTDGADEVEVVLAHFRAWARTVARLWPNTARVDLSGGRDSRLAAAAMLAENVDAEFVSWGEFRGEAEVARRLAAKASRPLQLRIEEMRDPASSPDRAVGRSR